MAIIKTALKFLEEDEVSTLSYIWTITAHLLAPASIVAIALFLIWINRLAEGDIDTSSD